MTDGQSTSTPRQLSAIAARIYTHGPLTPLTLRLLQRFRPYICPFEHLLPWVKHDDTVLDVGCGGGLFLALVTSPPGGVVRFAVGFDSSAAAIATAQATRAPRCRFERLDATSPWPPDPAHFDVVSIIDVLHHVPPAAQESVIRTAASRVAPGGILLYKDMCRRPLWRATMNRLHDLVLARQWIHYCPIADVEDWARDAGLTLEHQADLPRWWYGHELRVFRRPPPRKPSAQRHEPN